ncbi:MAG: hypothetical protein JXA43_01880 [Candidatus Diapherotrites archaeon]|nr:hypothetical protein [Candidatus Diapherotrites archaeon]
MTKGIFDLARGKNSMSIQTPHVLLEFEVVADDLGLVVFIPKPEFILGIAEEDAFESAKSCLRKHNELIMETVEREKEETESLGFKWTKTTTC